MVVTPIRRCLHVVSDIDPLPRHGCRLCLRGYQVNKRMLIERNVVDENEDSVAIEIDSSKGLGK